MTAAMSSASSTAATTLPTNSSLQLGSMQENHHSLVQVAFDYEYDYKTRKISVTQGEKLYLLQKTNQHWWKCMRPGVHKAFFVPAQYVNVLKEDENDHDGIKEGGDDRFPLRRGSSVTNKKSEIQKSTSSVDSTTSEIVQPKPRKSIFSTFERLKEAKLSSSSASSSSSTKPAVPSKNKSSISSRNEGSRASHRAVTKEKSHNQNSESSRHPHEKKSSSSSLRLKNWSASLEELSKQIVFPGLTSESVVDLTSLSANNSFKPSSIVASNKKHQQQLKERKDKDGSSGTLSSPPHNHHQKPNEQQPNTFSKTNTTANSVVSGAANSIEKRQDGGGGCTGANGSCSGGCDGKFHTINKCLSFRNPTFPNNNNDEKGSPTNEQNFDGSSSKERAATNDQNHLKQQVDSPISETYNKGAATQADSPMKSKDTSDGSLDTFSNRGGDVNSSVNSGVSLSGAPIPIPKGPPLRVLADNWAEYFSPEKNRYFYYNAEEKKTSWKPPRSSSNNRRSDECLATSSLIGRSGASTLGSSIENSLDNLYEEINNSIMMDVGGSRNSIIGSGSIISSSGTNTGFSSSKPDILQLPSSVGSSRKSVAALSTEELNVAEKSPQQNNMKHSGSINSSGGIHYEGSSSSVFDSQENLDSTSSPHLPQPQQTQQQEEDFSFANPTPSIHIPEGWDEYWDEGLQHPYYVNKVTGAKWFTSTDPQGKIYFYEENSSQSSWFLPENQTTPSGDAQDSALKPPNASSTTQPTDTANKSGSNSTSNSEEILSFGTVKKRHSAGDAIDRGTKSKSLFLPDHRTDSLSRFNNTQSLPRGHAGPSIWRSGEVYNIVKEGPLGRTKITEGGKKVRKNWGVVFAVLTETHLSLFKDQKSFAAHKSELEIELNGSTVEWTEEKSSRKNVFQLNTRSDLQMLFQSEDKNVATEWFENLKRISETYLPVDISMRLRSTEGPDILSDPPIGERKISSRLYRNKSTKLKITSSADDMGADRKKITANLKKFFSRRPPRESLVKKGIFKDEPVFGCSLEKLCMLEKRTVPRFVEECILAIQQKEENLKTDGIYRASGNLSQVQKIRLQVDQNNFQCLYQEEDVHVLAGSLKLFFREMKEPLISYDLFEKSFEAIKPQQKKEKVSKFRDIVKNLAKPNRDTLQALLKHLLKVAEYAEFNRMQIPNLAIVFGPTLMWPAIESKNMALDLMQQNYVIEALLADFESIFQP